MQPSSAWFFPAVAARVRDGFEWDGYTFPALPRSGFLMRSVSPFTRAP